MNNSLFRSILGTLHSLGGGRDGARPSRMGSRHLGGGSAGRLALPALLAAAALGAALPARASTFTIDGSGGTFTVTRSDTNAAETVRCRAVSRSALAGLHFMGNIGRLDFAAGERSKSVSVTEYTAAEINDPRFTYYQSNGATVNSRTYHFEVIDDGGFALAYADRAISYDASKSVSSATFEEKSVTVTNGEITVKDTGFAQAYHAVPLANYFSSTMPEDYLASSGANLRMLIDLQAAEVDDGYQYIQILINQTSNCDMPKKGSDNGDPGTVQISRYMAGFEHRHGVKVTNFKRYTFPVVSTNDNCGATLPWSDQDNDVGNLCMQRFNTNCRAADGRLVVPAQISSLGIRFTASGGDDDDWTAKSVVARIQAVPSAPSLIQNVNPAVTPAPVCKGSVVSVSLPFNEIVTVSGTPTLSTTWGNLAYVAGSGANVLTFAGPVTAAAGTALRITGLSGTVKGLTGTSFAWSGTTTVSGRTVDTLSAPPREGLVYQLSTSAHLLWFADRLATVPNTSAALAADIDLSNVGDFVPMGGANGFMGTFDGRGHVLSGLSVSSPASPAAPTAANPARYGLFGQIAAPGVVSNLVLSGATVSASLNPALVGAVCGRNLGTIALCSVLGGEVSTGPRSAVAPGTALGGICGENAGTVRACRVVGPLGSTGAVLYNRVKNDVVGGIAGTNAVSGTLESSYFHASFSNVENANITRGAVCGSNAGAIRRCVGLHDNYNYFNGAVGSDAGTVEDTLFPDAPAFSGGEVCYALNGGVTNGTQFWYQTLGADGDALPRLSATPVPGATVFKHGTNYCNEIVHDWRATWEHSPDYSNVTWTAVCVAGDVTNTLTVAGTNAVTAQATCTNAGTTVWGYDVPANAYGFVATNAVQHAPAALGHDWGAPAWSWNTDHTAATATFHCSRCDFDDTVSATVTRIVDGANIVSTATATHHGETFTATASVSATPWKALQVRLDLGGTVTLTNDMTATVHEMTLTVTNTVTLDLNGHTITHNGQGEVLSVRSGGNLTLTNNLSAGSVTGGGDHGVYVGSNAVFRLQGGAIAGNASDYAGGGVYVAGGGTFEMTGGAISGNTTKYGGSGGGVYVDRDGTFEMTGGEISGNTARYGGGGGVYVYDGGTFEMAGGEISGNTARYGGGVYVDYGGTFTMTGGAISGNTANYGGGVYMDGTFTVSGSPVVSGSTNSVGAADNVYLDSGRTIAVNGLSDGARIGVTTETAPTATAPVTFTAGASASDTAYFFSDNPAFALDIANSELVLRKPPTPWDLLQAQLDAGGTVTLTNDVTATDFDASLTVTNAVTLDLNGHTLDAAGRFSVIEVLSGGDLILTNGVPGSGAITGGKDYYGGGVLVYNGGRFTMAGGKISGNTATYGGGVYVRGGTFEMTGGAISGNSATYCGGVYVSNGVTFTMAGGEISGNAAKYDGGGVYVARGGTFEMTGGAISRNTADDDGGGVYMTGGTFEMTGGAIAGNTAARYGGGVYVYNGGTFKMTGGTISRNTASSNGGGVYVYGTFTVSGVSVVSGSTNSVGAANNVYLPSGKEIAVSNLTAGARIGVTTASAPTATAPVTFTAGASAGDSVYFFSDRPSVFVREANGEVILSTTPPTPWERLQAQLDAGGTVTLTNDVAAADGDASLTVTNAVTLDLNGHVLTHNGNGQALSVGSGGDLTLTNSLAAGAVTGGGDHGVYVGSNAVFRLQGGAIAGNESSYAGGGVFVDQFGTFEMSGGSITNNAVTGGSNSGGGVYVGGGTFEMTGGEISGNTAAWYGGGVYVDNRGTFEMTGGAISGNTARGGGGVYVEYGGTFEMTGGAISGNTASSSRGGGVEVASGGTFEMTGGAISGNTAKSYGGGVYVTDTFTMTGGAISGNTAGDDGGGVYVYGRFTVSGSPVVSGSTNSVGAANNVYLYSGCTIAVNGLSDGARIGVTTKTAPTASAPVTFTAGAAAGDSVYFFSDRPSVFVREANGEMVLSTTPPTPWERLQYRLDAGGTVTLTNDVTATDLDATLTVTNAVTLDLNGHTLTHNGSGQVLSVGSGGNLTLTNSLAAGAVTGGGDHGVYVGSNAVFRLQGGAIAGNASDYAGGGVFVDQFGMFEMTGGSITNNAVTGGIEDGGGVCVANGGTFTMTGGEISGNTATYGGGGVYVTRGGTFEMTGGEISGNTANAYGGGVFVVGTFEMSGGEISGNTASSGGGVCVYGTFKLSGGEISGNTASSGGGVCVYGTFKLSGGEISGNTAKNYGGGVYNFDGTFAVSGNPVVSGSTNSVGTADNVYLYAGRTITVNGLSPGARIGVTTKTTPTASAPVTFTAGAAAGDAAYFFSDVSGYHVEWDGTKLLLAFGTVYPAYLGLPADPGDDTDEDSVIRAKYDAWAQRYGSDALGANETAYLLDVAPLAVTNGVVPLKVAEMGVTNVLVSDVDFGLDAQGMGYDGGTLPVWRLVLASDMAPLKASYDGLMVCNGYLVLRIGTDLSVSKSEWLEVGCLAMVKDGRAELMCPAFILEKYRERVARETGKPCPGLFLSVILSPRMSSSTAFFEILQEELGDYLQ